MELYNKPSNLFVAGFIGAPQMNFFEVKINDKMLKFVDGTEIELTEGVKKQLVDYKKCILGIRPEHVSIDKVALDTFPKQVMREEITNLERMGNENHVFMKIGESEVPSRITETIGDKLSFMVDINKCYFLDQDSELRMK